MKVLFGDSKAHSKEKAVMIKIKSIDDLSTILEPEIIESIIQPKAQSNITQQTRHLSAAEQKAERKRLRKARKQAQEEYYQNILKKAAEKTNAG